MRLLSNPNWDLYVLCLRPAMRVSFVIMRAHQPNPSGDVPQAPTLVEMGAISPVIYPKAILNYLHELLSVYIGVTILVLRDLYKSLALGKLKVLGEKRYVTAL